MSHLETRDLGPPPPNTEAYLTALTPASPAPLRLAEIARLFLFRRAPTVRIGSVKAPVFISLILFIGALSWWFWRGGEEATFKPASTPTAEALTFGIPGSGPTTPAQDGPKPAEAGHAGVTPGPAEAVAPVESVAGIKLLDSWHRASTLQRPGMTEAARGAEGQALRDFASIWAGNAAAYKASLKTARPAPLGTEFQGYAEAWTKKGLKGLGEALATAMGPGPAWFAWSEVFVTLNLSKDKWGEAAPACGKLVRRMIAEGYSRERILEWIPIVNELGAHAGKFLPGDTYVVASGDSYWALCRKWADLGRTLNHGWVRLFNERTRTGLRAGETLSIPKVDLSIEAWRALRITSAWAGETPIRLWTSSMGEEGAETPVGEFTLGVFLDNPPWTNPRTGESFPAGNPENPLGTRWMAFKGQPSYGIHGTQDPATIGSFESWGCIRLRNEDVEDLFELVGPGTRVVIHP